MNCENCEKEHDGKYGSGRFCSSKCARGFSTKNKRKEINEKVSKKLKGTKPWNFDETLNRNNECKCGKKITPKNKSGYCKFCLYKSNEYRQKISKSNKLNPNAGGLRIGAGIGKCGWYKGYWCDSTWELAYVIYCLDHNIKIKRNKKGFEYVWKNKNRKYYPDFIVEGIFVEIKGYSTPQFEEKKKSFPNNLIVIGKNEIKPYLKYTKEKYGMDFEKLYE